MIEVITKYRRWLAVVVAALLIGSSCVSIYFISEATNLSEGSKAAQLAIPTLFLNLVSTVIAFLIASLLFRREDIDGEKAVVKGALAEALADRATEERDAVRRIVDEAVGRPNVLGQIHWAHFIENASEIDFVVQGWDRWAVQQPTAQALRGFFERGGKFRLYVCHPDSHEAERSRFLMEQRLGRTPKQVVDEIQNTVVNIAEIFTESVGVGVGGTFEVCEVNSLNWYFAASFRGRQLAGQARARDVLILSIYSHTPRKPLDMPVMVLHPDLHSDINMLAWFEKELEHLRVGAVCSSSPGRASSLPAKQ